LARLDTVTPHLHLRIHSPNKLESAISTPSHIVSSPVQTLAAGTAEWVRHKPLGRQFRPVEVTARQSISADVQLALNADGHGPQKFVQEVDLDVRQGVTDRDEMRLLVDARNFVPGREGCRLRWTIDVQEPLRWSLLQNLPDPHRLDRLAAKQKMPQSAKGCGELTGNEVEEGCGQEQDGDAVRFECCSQRVRSESYVLLDDYEARARQQRAPDLERGGVKGAIRDVGHCVRIVKSDVVRVADEVVNRAVRDRNAFRLPRRTRGIDNV